jgi:protein-histidine pros-kinase
MRLLAKFNLLLFGVFALSMAITGMTARNFLRQIARDQVLQQARLMMSAAGGMRTYTSKQVGPLLAQYESSDHPFAPQRVSAYAAKEIFNYLRQDHPAYTYKEATLNPTNLSDRAVDWEADVVETFRNHADQHEIIGERATPEGPSLYLARPLPAKPECLVCHSLPANAPASMLTIYGPDHGFGWNPNEIVAAQIVSVPMSVPLGMADRALKTLLVSLAGVFVLTLVLLDLGLTLVVIRPVTRMSHMADDISKGNLNVPEIPVLQSHVREPGQSLAHARNGMMK